VDDDREVVVAGVKVTFPRDHLQLELVQHQQFLRQVVPRGQRREPAGDAVDLAYAHVPDLPQRCLPGLQLPLRVQRQPDVWLPQQRLVALGLPEQAGAPGLQVEHDIQAGRGRGVDPWPQQRDR
jgi:hypothetical protein